MSFDRWHDFVEEKDTIVLHLSRHKMHAIVVEPGKVHQTKFGAFPHEYFIGKRFGAKVFSKNNKGYVHILHPTPEIWSGVLRHRTQILYPTDISLVLLELELKPGSLVIESGTGSGSLSHSIARTIAPNGHLYTFDFHQQRVDEARKEFEQHGISKYITCDCRDVCMDGFGIEKKVDAVFLDLPKPWEAIPAAKTAIKQSGGRICSFSPCVEQVQKSSEALRQEGFCCITTVECLLQTFDVRTETFSIPNFGQKNLQNEEAMRVIRQMKREGEKSLVGGSEDSKKLKTDKDETGKENEQKDLEKEAKKTTTLDNESIAKGLVPSDCATVAESGIGMVKNLSALQKQGNANILVARDNELAIGHTGYLTFASLYPDVGG